MSCHCQALLAVALCMHQGAASPCGGCPAGPMDVVCYVLHIHVGRLLRRRAGGRAGCPRVQCASSCTPADGTLVAGCPRSLVAVLRRMLCLQAGPAHLPQAIKLGRSRAHMSRMLRWLACLACLHRAPAWTLLLGWLRAGELCTPDASGLGPLGCPPARVSVIEKRTGCSVCNRPVVHV